MSQSQMNDIKLMKPLNESHQCLQCNDIAINPQQTECCGKLLCESCQKRVSSCPKCKQHPIKSFTDRRSHSEIQNLEVKCSNDARGCTWTGKLQELSEHRSACPKEEIACPYSEAGCKVQFLREDQDEHLSQFQKEHLGSAMETLKPLKREVTDMRKQIDELNKAVDRCQKALECCQRTPPLTLQLQNFTDFQQKQQPWYSPPFYTSARGYEVKLQVTPARANEITLSAEVIPGPNAPFLPVVCEGRVIATVSTQKNLISSTPVNFSFRGDLTKGTIPFGGHRRPRIRVKKQYDYKANVRVDTNPGDKLQDCVYIRVLKVEVDEIDTPWLEQFPGSEYNIF